MKKFLPLLILFLLVVIFFYSTPTPTQQLTLTPSSVPTVTSAPQTVLGTQIKTTGCIAHDGLPDSACTPGAIFTNATKEQICTRGYSQSVRNVPLEEKRRVYEEYGITSHQPGEYEVDHLISLELGGSNDIANLWPEAADPQPGFHQKDMVENYLHNQVCRGIISLQQAQTDISTNWLSVYQTMPK